MPKAHTDGIKRNDSQRQVESHPPSHSPRLFNTSLHISPCPTVQSAAEKAREKKLRDDPMAIVVGPLYVDCKRCGNRIKLSSKSSYDTFHWRTHRARCLKKPIGAQKTRRAKAPSSSPSPADSGGPPSPLRISSNRGILEPSKKAVSGSRLSGGQRSRPTNLDLLTSVASKAALRQPDVVLDALPEFSKSSSPAQWHDWRWSQLVAPEFSPKCHNSDNIRHDDMDEIQLRKDAIESLALLSRSG
ncbi:hypothetical protein AX17_002679 [Amanita inopinata Kibby_2008]|nr:hypothetical protein AX17_002679 [Amanita inopinata Kibby_2008]